MQLTPYSLQKLCFTENTIQSVSAEPSFCGSQTVKPFKKRGFSVFPVPAEAPIFVVFYDFMQKPRKDHFPKTDSVGENAFFPTSEHK